MYTGSTMNFDRHIVKVTTKEKDQGYSGWPGGSERASGRS